MTNHLNKAFVLEVFQVQENLQNHFLHICTWMLKQEDWLKRLKVSFVYYNVYTSKQKIEVCNVTWEMCGQSKEQQEKRVKYNKWYIPKNISYTVEYFMVIIN